MFQSYHFKQSLTLSYGSNYKTIMENSHNSPTDINHIGVQVLTSAELSSLVVDNPKLIDIVIDAFDTNLKRFAAGPEDRHSANRLFSILHEFKYMSSSPRPHMIAKILRPLHCLYFLDRWKPRTEMVGNQFEGKFNEMIINIEFYLFKIVQVFSQNLDFVNDREIIKEIFNTFCSLFKMTAEKYKQ